jgi:zinc/manganese transport system permease protein
MSMALDWTLLLPAFIAGLLVLATHVPLGIRVLSRGIVFIDLAIAQIAGLGVIAAGRLGFEPQGWGVQVSAITAALLGAALFSWTEKHWPEVQEATIGVLFVLAASGSILMVAGDPHGGDHLQDLLAGQILWVNPAQLWSVSLLTTLLVAILLWRRGRLGGLAFYGLFACAVTASVQLVGIYLVFASLILPALATRKITPNRRVPAALLLGALSYACGLMMANWLDLPPGPLIVWLLAILGLMLYAFSQHDSIE